MNRKIPYIPSSRLWALLAISSLTAWAQAPTGLSVKTATSKQVVLNWSGSSASYTVQRAPLGGSFTTLATAATATYTDNAIDPYTTYQYQVLNGTAASGSVTVGPPPSGVTNVAPAPLVGSTPSATYGRNISLALDGNGDPAFLFLWDDPNGDNDASDSQLLFRSWNRAQYKWNPVLKLATVGDVSTYSRAVDSLAYDSTTGVFAAATEVNLAQGDTSLQLFTSSDGGATWTLKNTFQKPATSLLGPSLALARGNLYLAYTLNPADLNYVTGQLNQAPTTWTTKPAPAFQGFTNNWGTGPSLALDSAGNPGIAYVADANNSGNGPVLFWRPTTGTTVMIMDSQGRGEGTNVKLAYYNLNPRVTVWLQRNDGDFGQGVHFGASNDAGVTWQNPVLVPPDGDSSSDFPFDMALDSRGDVAIGFGQNSNAGDDSHRCGNPKISLSTDLVHFTTCSFAPKSVTENFSVYPAGLQLAYGGNDKLYVMWLESSDTQANTGVLMYREPPAGAATAPAITSVSDNNITRATIVAGSWISIFGSNLAGTTRTWGGSDFNNGDVLPTALDGVSVKVNGLPAAVYYISPTQINVQAPAPLSGSVSVQVTYNGAASNTLSVNAVANAPSLFSYTIGTTTFPSALFPNSTIIVGDPALAGNIVAKAKPGDVIQLYGNALGGSPAGSIVHSVIVFGGSLTATIGGQNAPVQFAGLVASGEYQINVLVPSLGPGMYPVVITANGQASQSGVMVPIQ